MEDDVKRQLKNEDFKKNDKAGSQRIECNVTNCTHNCIEDSTCRLNKIQVSPMRYKRK